ncbi:hypothetical protein LI177_10905 [bacterium 210820-DFI.6.37]|nr:hypothetical protein [bacterium 210820-DFI.6.37]
MRHIFIINPLAGKRGGKQKLEAEIRAAGKKLGVKTEIYETKAQGDGAIFVKKVCEENKTGERIRFYACGGDGALNEVANGAFGFSCAEVGCLPLGTGNDYVRNYGSLRQFLDIEAQIKGQPADSDLIRYRADGGLPRLCVNMFNIGFDCNVVDQTSRVKNWPLVKGSFAYLLSVAIILIKKKGADLRICYEDGYVFDGKLLLIAIANGCYCGGGVKGVPLSVLDDGLMDVSLIRDVPRGTFVQMFPKYAKGTHLMEEKLQGLIDYRKCKRLTVTANRAAMRLCTDGEITDAKQVTFEVVPKGMRFSLPEGVGARQLDDCEEELVSG